MATQEIRNDARTAFVAVALTLLACVTLIAPVEGQTLWTGEQPYGDARASIHLEVFRPDFADPGFGFHGATGAGFVTVRVPVTPRWALVGDLPFSRAAWNVEDEAGTSKMIGNPYVGAELRASDRVTAEAGVRLPTGDLDEVGEPLEDALAAILVGMAGELERLEAFAPQTVGLYAAASYHAPLSGPLSFRVRGNSTVLTGEGTAEDLLLGYTGQVWYDRGRADVGAGITGRVNVTDDDEDADRAAHQIIAAGAYRFGKFRPGVQLRLPLDKTIRDITGVTAGLSLAYSF